MAPTYSFFWKHWIVKVLLKVQSWASWLLDVLSLTHFCLDQAKEDKKIENQNVLNIRKYSWTIYQSVPDAFSIPGNLTLFICNEISRPRWEIAAEQFSGMGFIYHNFRAILSHQYISRPNLNGGKGLAVTTFLPPVWSKYCLTLQVVKLCTYPQKRKKLLMSSLGLLKEECFAFQLTVPLRSKTVGII